MNGEYMVYPFACLLKNTVNGETDATVFSRIDRFPCLIY